VTFRDRLIATIGEARLVLELPDIRVVGSEVPNLLEPDAAATLATEDDLSAFDRQYRSLAPDLRHVVRANLTVLSLLSARDGMPDPAAHRERVADVLARFEAVDGDTR
jgi:uncharacterized protein (UPF0371 family)